MNVIDQHSSAVYSPASAKTNSARPADGRRTAGERGIPEKNDATLDGRAKNVAAEAAPTSSVDEKFESDG